MTMRSERFGIRAIARFLGRSAGTISRELANTSGEDGTYNAELTHHRSNRRRTSMRKISKLDKNSELFKIVYEKLKLLWSPQQIARHLNAQWPDNREKSVSHEAIYTAIYRQPRGAFKRELVSCLRHHNQIRKPRSRGKDHRNQIKDMQSIHIRPADLLRQYTVAGTHIFEYKRVRQTLSYREIPYNRSKLKLLFKIWNSLQASSQLNKRRLLSKKRSRCVIGSINKIFLASNCSGLSKLTSPSGVSVG
jgi:IS30 family transposase